MPADPIRLICLDLGGVVMRICRGWDEACRAACLPLPDHRLDAREMARHIGPIVCAHESGMVDEAEFDARVAAPLGLTPEQVAATADAWLRGPYPEANDLLRRVAHCDGVRSACLSNTNRRHWRAMTSPGPNELALRELTWRFTSFEAGYMKPDAAIYAYVERVVDGAGIAPRSILFFDDHPANVAAARERGWNAELIDPDTDPPGQVLNHLDRYGIRLTV